MKPDLTKTWLHENWCTKLLKNTNKDYFSKLNPKLVLGNKNFWRTIKPYFSDQGKLQGSNKIMISAKNCLVSDDRRLFEMLMNILSILIKL